MNTNSDTQVLTTLREEVTLDDLAEAIAGVGAAIEELLPPGPESLDMDRLEILEALSRAVRVLGAVLKMFAVCR